MSFRAMNAADVITEPSSAVTGLHVMAKQARSTVAPECHNCTWRFQKMMVTLRHLDGKRGVSPSAECQSDICDGKVH